MIKEGDFVRWNMDDYEAIRVWKVIELEPGGEFNTAFIEDAVGNKIVVFTSELEKTVAPWEID